MDELMLNEGRCTELLLSRHPEVILEEARTAAKALQNVVANKARPVIFNGEQYLEFEDLQTVGRFYGITVKVTSTQFIDLGGVQGFEARAVALRADGQEISAADAMCLNDEGNWKSKPLFQLRSMAQTRACAKALRNVLAWVVVLAGYKPTPAEEMQGVFNGGNGQQTKPAVTQPQSKSGAQQAQAATQATEVIEALIEDVKIKEGSSAKGPWTKYGIIAAGNTYGTFDKKIGDLAIEHIGHYAEIHYTHDGKFLTAFEVIPISIDDREPGQDG